MYLDTKSLINFSKEIVNEVKKVIIGKDDVVVKVFLAILAKGHILIEDIPGVGKTTMMMAYSKALSLRYNRVQFTPDVLPADVTGFNVYNKQTGSFEYREGAAICNLFLADEINRTSSKTQSALLEVMEEGRVTVDSVSREVPKPYIVIATQNPVGSVGTQMLPDSQLDRFMIRLSIGYPDVDGEMIMLKSKQNTNPLDTVNNIATAEDLINMQSVAEMVHVDEQIYRYIAELASATRSHPLIKLGLSPRGTIALTAISKATALLSGRDYVLPEDIKYIFNDVAAHRIILNSKARINNTTTHQVLEEVKRNVNVPKITSRVI